MKINWKAPSLLLLLFGAALPGLLAANERPADHVVLISIDGLIASYVTPSGDRTVDLSNIQALRARGSWAEGVISQYPSLTYPSHTSIVTGERPSRHGVFQNTRFAPTGSPSWYFEASAITSPALWQVASRAGLVSAAVSWPVTVGADIEYLYPEVHQDPPGTTWLELSRRESTPGLIDEVVEKLGGFGARDNLDPIKRDRFAVAVTTHVMTSYRPNLLLVHLVQTDYAQHSTGPHSAESLAAFERADTHVGEIVAAVEAAGVLERTCFIITGDHGFYRVHSAFQPNVVLREAGLFETDETGRVTGWKAIAHRAAIRIADPEDTALAARVFALFEELAGGKYRGLLEVIDRRQLDALGADPDALLYLEPAEGYTISESLDEDRFLVSTERRGNHGYLPTREAMHTGLVISGSGVRQGIVAPIARQIDLAPTVARLLGFDMAAVEGQPMVGLLVE